MTIKRSLLASAVAVSLGMSTSFALAETVTMLHNQVDQPKMQELFAEFEQEFEAQNPDIDVVIEMMADEQFKAKLPTMLQSDAAPDVFYDWGGGNLTARAEAGLLGDISPWSRQLERQLSAGGIEAYTRDGGLYGVPYTLAQVGFWYNKELFEQAGVDGEKIRTWDDLMEAVADLKAAGITPIAVGGADKWPVHFWWTYLAMRTGGLDTFQAAMTDEAPWDNEAYVEAGELFAELVAMDPFQEGFLAAGYADAAGAFGDHKAAMHLMGDWDIGVQRSQSQSKEGVTDENLGFFSFPRVRGGDGKGGDTLGGVNGFAVSKNGAREATVKWLEYFTAEEQQARLAAEGLIIPVAKGADSVITDPHKKLIAENIAKAKWHQVFWDQELGADVGGVINDVSAELASADISPEEAVERIQEAWEFR